MCRSTAGPHRAAFVLCRPSCWSGHCMVNTNITLQRRCSFASGPVAVRCRRLGRVLAAGGDWGHGWGWRLEAAGAIRRLEQLGHWRLGQLGASGDGWEFGRLWVAASDSGDWGGLVRLVAAGAAAKGRLRGDSQRMDEADLERMGRPRTAEVTGSSCRHRKCSAQH